MWLHKSPPVYLYLFCLPFQLLPLSFLHLLLLHPLPPPYRRRFHLCILLTPLISLLPLLFPLLFITVSAQIHSPALRRFHRVLSRNADKVADTLLSPQGTTVSKALSLVLAVLWDIILLCVLGAGSKDADGVRLTVSGLVGVQMGSFIWRRLIGIRHTWEVRDVLRLVVGLGSEIVAASLVGGNRLLAGVAWILASEAWKMGGRDWHWLALGAGGLLLVGGWVWKWLERREGKTEKVEREEWV